MSEFELLPLLASIRTLIALLGKSTLPIFHWFPWFPTQNRDTCILSSWQETGSLELLQNQESICKGMSYNVNVLLHVFVCTNTEHMIYVDGAQQVYVPLAEGHHSVR